MGVLSLRPDGLQGRGGMAEAGAGADIAVGAPGAGASQTGRGMVEIELRDTAGPG